MRYSIVSVLLASLYLAGCGGSDDKENTSTETPNQPQTTENTVHTTLGNNLKVANLANVAQATFSAEYANNNPVITVKRTQDATLSEPFNFAKKIFDIEKNADYEVSLSSSKPFDSAVDVDFVVPSNLLQALSDQNALVVYVAIGGEEDDLEKEFIPIESTYNESTQKLSAILPSWLLQQNENSEPSNIIFKIGLAKTEIPAILAVAKSIVLPDNGEDVLDERNFFPKLECPISNGVCIETSRFGHRKPGTEGASLLHKGMDFRAELNTPLISSVNGTITDIIEKSGTVVIKLKGLNKYVIYRHLNKIDKAVNSVVNAGDQIGLSGNKKNIVDGKQTTLAPHLHVELIGMKNNLACKIDTTKVRTCNNLILSPLDPMPYYVKSMKIKKISPQESSIAINQNFNIELQAFDVKGNQIKTEIDNSYSTSQRVDPNTGKMKTIVNPQGTLRSTNWKIEPESTAYTIKTDAKLAVDTVLGFVRIGGDILSKRSSSTVTVNNPESATITAYWDGLESLKANYEIEASSNYWTGYARITECESNTVLEDGTVISGKNYSGGAHALPSDPYLFGCNILSGNFNVGDGATISFREGSENLNIRMDQQYGCYGSTANINPRNLAFSVFQTDMYDSPIIHDFKISKETDQEVTGTFTSSTKWSDGTTTKVIGTWEVTKKSSAFPKCLAPTLRLDNTPKSFCPVFDGYGCDFRSINSEARESDWLP